MSEPTTVVGNGAKMREALVLALSLLDLKEGVSYKTVSQKDLDFMKDALAAPPRNCDVGMVEEQHTRFCAWCHKRGIDGNYKVDCAHPDMSCDLCALRWAQMPYESEMME